MKIKQAITACFGCFSLIVVFGVSLYSGDLYAGCYQTHSCSRVISDNPITGKIETNDPVCETAKAAANLACSSCIAGKAATLGLTAACVGCVVANFSTAAAGTPICIEVCGSAVAVEKVANSGNCP